MSVKERVLVVDDDESLRDVLARILHREGYRHTVVGDIAAAEEVLTRAPFDVLLCDVNLPDGSGLDVVERALRSHESMATLVISGIDDVTVAGRALSVGAHGYLVKPFSANEVLIAVLGALRHHRAALGMRDTLRAAHEESIHRLCPALEASNPDAPQHISRMSDLCWLIGQELGMSAADCALIRVASPMHDVGIVGVSDWILRKPAALTEPERDEIQRHAEIGYRMLAGSRSTVLEAAATIAWTHHEWYDGSGYPRGLKGSEIPLEGRIAAVADVYDSLTRDRPYRARLEHADAVQVLEMERGKHFDPNVVDPFISALQRQSTHAAVEWTGWGAGRSAVPKDRPPTLTPREREVLQLAADGRSGRDIAGALVLSPGTVKTHFQNIYAKLGAHDRAAAVAAGLRRGIIN